MYPISSLDVRYPVGAGRRLSRRIGALVVLVASTQLNIAAAMPSTRYVDKQIGIDGGDCIAQPCLTVSAGVSAAQDGDTVVIAAGTYYESGIALPAELTLIGAGADVTVIDGAGSDPIFFARTIDVSIADITLQNGNADSAYGGVIEYGGTLRIERSRIFQNQAAFGGAIAVGRDAVLDIDDSTFDWNKSTGDGGAIWCDACALIDVGNSVFEHNETDGDGGAIYLIGENLDGENAGIVPLLLIRQSELLHNTAQVYGGAVRSEDSDIKIRTSELYENKAQFGGGVAFLRLVAGTLELRRSTLADNAAAENNGGAGGGLLSMGGGFTSTIVGSTFSGNRAGCGGAMSAYTQALVSNATFRANEATQATCGGQVDAAPMSVTLSNSILANGFGAAGPACTIPLFSGTHNRIDDATCNTGAAAFNLGPVTGLDPSLAFNGGPTRTHTLLFQPNGVMPVVSNAIDAGNPAACFALVDQRGEPRRIDHVPQSPLGIAVCDIGAVELRASE